MSHRAVIRAVDVQNFRRYMPIHVKTKKGQHGPSSLLKRCCPGGSGGHVEDLLGMATAGLTSDTQWIGGLYRCAHAHRALHRAGRRNMDWVEPAETSSAPGEHRGAAHSKEAGRRQRSFLAVLGQLFTHTLENVRSIDSRPQSHPTYSAALAEAQCARRLVAAKHQALCTAGSGAAFKLPWRESRTASRLRSSHTTISCAGGAQR